MANTSDGKQIFCSVCGNEILYNRGRRKGENPLCNKHLLQMKRHGKILERTFLEKNEIIITDDYVEIILRNRDQEEVGRAVVSLNKLGKVKDTKWNLHSAGYASSGAGSDIILLHRLIADAKENEFIDHRNRNKLDCRDENLRRCTKSQNAMNTKISKRNTSGNKGVWFNKNRNKWVAEIFVEGKKISLGHYEVKENAIKSRIKAEVMYFGDFSSLEGVKF